MRGGLEVVVPVALLKLGSKRVFAALNPRFLSLSSLLTTTTDDVASGSLGRNRVLGYILDSIGAIIP